MQNELTLFNNKNNKDNMNNSKWKREHTTFFNEPKKLQRMHLLYNFQFHKEVK